MNLQESIRRILREEKELSTYFRRRVTANDLERLVRDVKISISGGKDKSDALYDAVQNFISSNKEQFKDYMWSINHLPSLIRYINSKLDEEPLNESVLREESNKDILIDGLYDPIYEENGIVLFKEPKHLSVYSKFGIKKSNIISGKEFNKKYVDFNSKKLHKVLYKDGITLGGNLGEGKYWCSTEYCLSVYLGETHQSREYSKYVKEVVDFKLGDGLKILVKKYISDDLW